MKSVGFKEWAIVCEALGRGRQNIILRKGGIAEGKDGFAFRHLEFFLFPTFFHEQIEKTHLTDVSLPAPNESEIEIRFFAKVEHLSHIQSWQTVARLEPFHVLEESVVRERFVDARAAGIHAALVRVYRLEPGWVLPNDKRYGGCRSWVELSEPPGEMDFLPVLKDAEFATVAARFRAVIDQGGAVQLAASTSKAVSGSCR